MGRVGLRSIRAHLGRFVMSLLAVTLGVAFVAGTFSLRAAMSGTFDDIVTASTNADAYLRSDPDEGSSIITGESTSVTFPLDLVDEIEQIDGVRTAIPAVSASAILVGADGTAVGGNGAPAAGAAWYPEDPTWEVVAGRGPERAGEIAIETSAMGASGLSIGDTTQAILNGEITEQTVVGELDAGTPMMGATFFMLDEDTALDLFAAEGQTTQVAVFAADGADSADVDTVVAAMSALAPEGTQALTGEEMRQEQMDQVSDTLGIVVTLLLVFAAIALFVGAFIISNTFAQSVRMRMRELAVLRAVGASPRQVVGSVLVQAVVIGVVGSLLGVLAGLGLVQLVSLALSSMDMEMSGGIPLDATTVVIALTVGVLVSVVSAAIPARRAATVPPVDALRDEVTVPEHSLRRRGWAGLVLTAAGVGAVVASMVGAEEGWATTALGAGAVGVLLGVLMLSPVLARSVIGVLAWPFVKLLRPVGRLARGNVVRNPRRTANTSGALMVGMTLVGAVSVIALSVSDSMADVIEEQIHGDVLISGAAGEIPSGAVAEIEDLPEAGVVDVVEWATVGVADPSGGATDSAMVVAFPAETLPRSLTFDLIAGDIDALARDEILVKEDAATAAGWQVGDTVTFVSGQGHHDLTIGAITDNRLMDAGWYVTPEQLDLLVPEGEQVIGQVVVHAADGVSVTELSDAITEVAAPYLVLTVQTSDEFADAMAEQVNQILIILYALLALSIVIAVLGIVNTLAMSVLERTREIGLLRAVGLGRLQLSGTVVVESVLTAVFGTLLGLLVGVGLAAAMPTVMADIGFTTLSIPWGTLGVMVALAVGVGVLAAGWPAVRAARMNVLEAVSYE